jgi:hypothetical protein
MCDCRVCKKIFRGNPDNIIRFADNPDLLRRHFLVVRRREADALESTSLSDELERLGETYERYHDSISSLPNPDAIVDPSAMRGLGYLQTWIEGFST